jgi:hypothetical protein
MATITTYEYCVIKDEKHYTGSKSEIIRQIFKWRLENKQLIYKCEGYIERKAHSYSEHFTDQEIQKDVVQFLFGKLKSLNCCRIYRDIGI